ncbi:MAG: LON peptidase substrate-binding domain-containing protein [Myxococcaceae bacterium]
MAADPPAEGFPVISLRGVTLFPGASLRVEIEAEDEGRLRKAFASGDSVAALTRSPTEDRRFFTVGTLARVRGFEQMPEGGTRVELEGVARFRVNRVGARNDAHVSVLTELPGDGLDEQTRSAMTRLSALVRELSAGDHTAMLGRLDANTDPGAHADLIASELDSLAARLKLFGNQRIAIPVEEKQAVLEAVDPWARMALVTKQLLRLRQISTLSTRIEEAQARERPQTREQHLRLVVKVIEQALAENPDDPRYLSSFLAGLRKELGQT